MSLSTKPLNVSGITHIFVIMLVVVGVSIFGAYALITSHADTLTIINPPTVKCAIGGVPAKFVSGNSFTPTLTVTNISNKIVSSHWISFVSSNSSTTYFNELVFWNLAPGMSKTKQLGSVTPAQQTFLQVLSHYDGNYGPANVNINPLVGCSKTSLPS